MSLSWHTAIECKLDSAQDSLFIVMEDKRLYLRHLTITAGALEEMALQPPECIRHLGKGRAVTQRTRLALNDSEVVPPVIDCTSQQVM